MWDSAVCVTVTVTVNVYLLPAAHLAVQSKLFLNKFQTEHKKVPTRKHKFFIFMFFIKCCGMLKIIQFLAHRLGLKIAFVSDSLKIS